METILIISGFSLVAALALIGVINFRSRKNKVLLDTDIKIRIKTKYSTMEYLLAHLINHHRECLELSTLTTNDTISTVCQEHSLNLSKLISIKHENALLRKNKLKRALGITGSGEIVAKGTGTAEGTLLMWLKSPKHKATIERGYWTEFGISIEKSILRRNYITVIFTK